MEELLPFYQAELAELKKLGAEFSKKHPKVASHLGLDHASAPNPDVERLIEAAAFMNARIRHKLDDDFPEITNTLLNLLYPHYQCPVPSLLMAECHPLPDMTKISTLPRGTTIETSPEYGNPISFQTCYEISLLPIEIISIKLFLEKDQLKVKLQCLDEAMTFSQLAPTAFRFFIDSLHTVRFSLYELLFTNLKSISIGNHELSKNSLYPVGFSENETLLPYDARTPMAYRLLTEFFIYPEKFLFIDLKNLDRSIWQSVERECEIIFHFNQVPLEIVKHINKDTFKLHCTPVINLFHQKTEPLLLSHTQTEYQIIPNMKEEENIEIYQIETIKGITEEGEIIYYDPFCQHHSDYQWHALRKAGHHTKSHGEDFYLTFVGKALLSKTPKSNTLQIEALCFHRDLTQHPAFRDEKTEWQLAEISAPIRQIKSLTSPTQVIRRPLGKTRHWDLLSHLALNYYDLSRNDRGLNTLKELLKLYAIHHTSEITGIIESLESLKTRSITRRLIRDNLPTFCQGLEIHLEIDESFFVGNSLWLLGSVLDHFLARLASINSFTQLVITSKNKQKMIHQFPPRIGNQLLL